MDTHDGNIIQFAAGGPYYMYRCELGFFPRGFSQSSIAASLV